MPLRPSEPPPDPSPVPGRPTVTVAVPAYNEVTLFGASMELLLGHLAGLADRFDVSLLVVDDGSTDGTAEVADALAASRPDVEVVHHGANRRLGGVMRSVVAQARGDWVITYDCDLSYSPDHIDRMLATALETDADIVIASPYLQGGRSTAVPRGRLLQSRAANRVLSLTAQGRLSTLTGMVRCYRGDFLRGLDLKAVDIDVNVEMVYKAQLMRAKIVEIPAHLDWSQINAGRGTPMFTARNNWNTAKSLVSAFLFRPFLFFLLPGTLTLGLGIVLALLGNRGEDVAVPIVVGVLLLGFGLISLQIKRYFEELYHLGSSVLRRLPPVPEPPPASVRPAPQRR